MIALGAYLNSIASVHIAAFTFPGPHWAITHWVPLISPLWKQIPLTISRFSFTSLSTRPSISIFIAPINPIIIHFLPFLYMISFLPQVYVFGNKNQIFLILLLRTKIFLAILLIRISYRRSCLMHHIFIINPAAGSKMPLLRCALKLKKPLRNRYPGRLLYYKRTWRRRTLCAEHMPKRRPSPILCMRWGWHAK